VILVVVAHAGGPPLVVWGQTVAAAILVAIPLGLADLAIYRRLRTRLDRARPQRLQRGVAIYAAIYAIVAVVFVFKR